MTPFSLVGGVNVSEKQTVSIFRAIQVGKCKDKACHGDVWRA
jgi:hypothetical protein